MTAGQGLIPSIGRITLADLTGRRLQACFNLLSRQRTKNGTPIAPSTVDRVRATLRSALNAAAREGLIAANPLAHARLDKPVRPHPVIWTDERVEAWRRDSIRPPVAVWTLRQLVTFLTGVEDDRLAALWWLIALRGLRRGEAAAPDRDDLGSESRELTISRPAHRAAGGTVLRAAEEPGQLPDDRPGRGRHPQAGRPGRQSDGRAAAAPVRRAAPQRLPRPPRPRGTPRPGRAGHRRNDHPGSPQRPRGQTQRRACDPHPGRGHRVRLLSDVSSHSSKPYDTRDLGSSRGRAASHRCARA